MTRDMDTENMKICYYMDESYKQDVEDGDPNSWLDFSIMANDTDIYGNIDECNGVTGLASNVMLDLLTSLEMVNSGEKSVIEFEFGPTWLILQPLNEESVSIERSTTYSGIKDPEDRLEIDTSEAVSKYAFQTEIVSTAKDFVDDVKRINSELCTNDNITAINNKIGKISDKG